MCLIVHFRLLGIEKGIENAKENIRKKGFTRGSQEVESRALCGHTVPSCVCMCPWERFGPLLRSRGYKVKTAQFVDRATAREEAEEEEENRETKEAWNYNNLIIGALNTKPKDEKKNLECQKTTPRHGKTQRKPRLGVVHFWLAFLPMVLTITLPVIGS
ncbi:hypothetical protein PIB30_079886 [Stylosanthes scabra]|uniref:Uncharacterized protein n=1 Tax=Stylosanthes scabra TaxID=79078 RepID=A0ABU6XQF1_9FABA|nr:hypothetical protein [Stylosanthes scabra]